MYIPSLNKNFGDGLMIIATIGILLTIISYFVANFREPECVLTPVEFALLYLIRFLHYAFLLFGILYVFVFHFRYDFIYICFMIAVYMHWKLFKNECILSYWEKKLIDKSYKMGANPMAQPFINMFIQPALYQTCFFTLFIITLLFVLVRNIPY
jgi:hypothetical protein